MLAIDKCLALLPPLLSGRGLALKQKRGYKVGKLSNRRNWCQFIDGDARSAPLANSLGKMKTWKLFARFDNCEPPLWPWDRPERHARTEAYWVILGDDVWGVAYEDVRECLRSLTEAQLLERLATDLGVSFAYSRKRYL